ISSACGTGGRLMPSLPVAVALANLGLLDCAGNPNVPVASTWAGNPLLSSIPIPASRMSLQTRTLDLLHLHLLARPQIRLAPKPILHRRLQRWQRHPCADLHPAVAHRQRVVKTCLAGKAAHGEVVEMRQRARPRPLRSHQRHGQLARVHAQPSFFLSSSLASPGAACPREAFITWPTKNASSVVLPARYWATCPGFWAITSSTIFSTAPLSEICRMPIVSTRVRGDLRWLTMAANTSLAILPEMAPSSIRVTNSAMWAGSTPAASGATSAVLA